MKTFKTVISLILALTLLSGISLTCSSALVADTDDISTANLSELDNMISSLNEKIIECSRAEISTDYESSRLALLKLYSGYLKDDLKNGLSINVSYTLRSLNGIYTDAMQRLQSYLNGSVKPIKGNYYSTGAIAVKGDDIYATSTASSGEELTYFVGFGHGSQVINDMEHLKEFGFNCIQISICPSEVIYPLGKGSREGLSDDDKFSIDTSYIKSFLIPTLEKAAKNNIAVSLLLSPHVFPRFLCDVYPDLKNENTGFQKYNIYHPAAKRVIEVFLETVLPMIKNSPSLMELCLTNEPHYRSSRCEYDIPAWQKYLHEKYADIKALNKTLGTNYPSFEDVIMPRNEEASSLMYEWVQFNNRYYSEWHQWMADIVKANAPGIPISAKTMSYTDDASQRIMYGVDVEQFDKFSDLNGSNAWNTLYRNNTTEKLEAYDLLTSISEKPVINSEDHVVYDASVKYLDEKGAKDFAQHCYADVWQGAVHGRNASMYWIWERTADTENSCYNSVLMRPASIVSMSDATLDVNRLANEINALNSADENPDVYILFSNTSRVYSRMYTKFVKTAYEGALYAGKTVRFVTENNISGMKPGKLLIVPNCTNVPEATLSAIKHYIENGSKVLMLGKCLTRNEYDKVFDNDDITYIYDNADIFGSNPISKIVELFLRLVRAIVGSVSKIFGISSDLDLNYAITKNILGTLYSPTELIVVSDDVKDKIIELTGESAVTLKDSDGKLITNCEIRTAEYNGKILVNVCSYDWENTYKNISVYLNGKQVSKLVNRLTETAVNGSFTILPYTPLLLEFAAK